jgi:hypothetical protein
VGDVIYLDLEGYHRADCLKGNKTAGCSGEVEQAEVIDVGSSKLESEMVLFGSAREADSESRLQEQFLGEELGRGEESGCLGSTEIQEFVGKDKILDTGRANPNG